MWLSDKYNFKKLHTYILTLVLSLAFLMSAYHMYGYSANGGQLMNSRFTFCKQLRYYTLPSNRVIDAMNYKTVYLTFKRYIKQKQIECDNVRKAGAGFTGKNILFENLENVRNNCLVYSFGSQFEFSFEEAIFKSFQCEIHTFDPSFSIEGIRIPRGVNFHLTGLSNIDGTIQLPAPKSNTTKLNMIWKMRTLSTIKKSLQHTERLIDILKIDVEGWEWPALEQMLKSGILKTVKQICLEVHFGYNYKPKLRIMRLHQNNSTATWGNTSMHNQLKVLKDLHDFGFRTFMFDTLGWAIMKMKRPKTRIHSLVEISLLNINFI